MTWDKRELHFFLAFLNGKNKKYGRQGTASRSEVPKGLLHSKMYKMLEGSHSHLPKTGLLDQMGDYNIILKGGKKGPSKIQSKQARSR